MRMLRSGLVIVTAVAVTALAPRLDASGPVGIYGIVERVVLEPNQTAPERIQIWGVFAYVDGCAANPQWATTQPIECGVTSAMRRSTDTPSGLSPVERGYLYFALPALVPGGIDEGYLAAAKREWADIRAVAGTGQAIGFGRWGYIGGFQQIRPDRPANGLPLTYANVPGGGRATNLGVRSASEPPTEPAIYQINYGVVRLDDRGTYAGVVAQLRSKLP